MKGGILLYLLIHLSIVAFAQIKEDDIPQADLLENQFASRIDSSRILKNKSILTYSSDSLFKAIHLILQDGRIRLVDLRYRDNYRGYVAFGADFKDYVLFKSRGDGAGNPVELLLLDKRTGEESLPGHYPIFTDSNAEVIVFKADDQVIIRDFKKDKTESYELPPDNLCTCCDCWNFRYLNSRMLALTYTNHLHQEKELLIKRE